MEKALNKDTTILRKGQILFSDMYKAFPEEVNTLRGTIYDCFYDNTKISIFLEELRKKLKI